MRSGTPGFVGARLREAREARAVTAVALSDLVGVSPQAISHYEYDRASPSPEVMQDIARRLNLPEPFFTRPVKPTEKSTIFYRSMSSATKGARVRAERRFAWLKGIVAYLTEHVTIPRPNFPELRFDTDPALLSDVDVEEAAEEARHYWDMRDSPIGNVVALLENQGAIVARDQMMAQSLDSLSEFDSTTRRPFVVLGTDKGSAVRWRFDAAHELGHILLHASVDQRRFSKLSEFKRMEEQAHRFAAAFLLPRAAFAEDLFSVSLDALRAIKPKWKVSIGMMIMRARHSDLISEADERRMWINYSRRGWRRIEPLDETLEPEEPRILRRSVELLLTEGLQTPEDILARLALPAWDVEGLCGMPKGFLEQDFTRISVLPREDSATEESGTLAAEVIQMPYRPRE